ncbi:hypothetical protein [Endozoicomonas sp. SCSIO W0465]|nr:hypothetical protein [Endozoicomonas sp. SCSIO W0465]
MLAEFTGVELGQWRARCRGIKAVQQVECRLLQEKRYNRSVKVC